MCEPRPVNVELEPMHTTPVEWGEPRTRSVTWHDPLITAAGALERSGLEALEAIRDGILPPPPIAMLMQFDIRALEEGRVEFGCTLDESVYNPIGVVHGGLVCTLLDTVAGCAVHSTLPAGFGYTSIELKVNYLRAAHRDRPRREARPARGLRRGRGPRRPGQDRGHGLQFPPGLPAADELTGQTRWSAAWRSRSQARSCSGGSGRLRW
jgi:uncharacterized protein (TIGR00369 family)